MLIIQVIWKNDWVTFTPKGAAQSQKFMPWSFQSSFVWDSTWSHQRDFYALCALGSRWPRCVTLRGLPLHGGVAVAPKRFHLAVTPLTADRGITRSEHISWTDSLQRWDPATEPRSTQQDLQKDAFFHKCLEKSNDNRIFPKTKQNKYC